MAQPMMPAPAMTTSAPPPLDAGGEGREAGAVRSPRLASRFPRPDPPPTMRTISRASPSRTVMAAYCFFGTTSPLTATAMRRTLTFSEARRPGREMSRSRSRGLPLMVTEIMGSERPRPSFRQMLRFAQHDSLSRAGCLVECAAETRGRLGRVRGVPDGADHGDAVGAGADGVADIRL